MADRYTAHPAARFLDNDDGAFFKRITEMECRSKPVDHMWSASVVQSENDNAHNPAT